MSSRYSLKLTLERFADLTGDALGRLLDRFTNVPEFYGMMRYHVGWVDERFQPVSATRGKGLRAAFLMLVNEAIGGDESAAVPLAVAVELLHNFSLVHDDIEDGSTLRRHRATMWSIWGAPLSINVGDGLYAAAHLAMLESPLRTKAPEQFIDIIEVFEHTALRLCEGQHDDMTLERSADASVDDYIRMISGKTAALIGCCASIGARCAGATPDQTAAAARFGRDLGLAFQIQDDILGIWGDEAVTGKSASSDIASRKKSLPVVLAMTRAEAGMRDHLHTLYSSRDHAEDDAGAALAILNASGARALSARYLHRYRSSALAALRDMRLDPEPEGLLRQFAELFIDRSA